MVAIELTALALKALPGAAASVLSHAPRLQTASIGIPDTLFLMLLALVVFGPRRLPEIGRQIGKLMYEFRKVSNDFKFQMEEELRASEEADRLKKVQAAFQTPIQPAREVPATPALEAGTESVPAVAGEVRAETPKAPQIAPPSTGEPIAAPRPFRQNFSESAGAGVVEQTASPGAGAAEEVQHG